MAITSDEQKINVGPSLKFEAKVSMVADYSRKEDRHWGYGEKAVDLIIVGLLLSTGSDSC